MSADSQNNSPNHTIQSSIDGCGIHGVTVDEGQSKEEVPKDDAAAPAEEAHAAGVTTNSTQEQPAPATVEPTKAPEEVSPSVASSVSSPDVTPVKKGKKKKKEGRCNMEGCRKKIGLTGFECRCGSVFCSIHRYSDAHECTFDYKALARDQLNAANPVISPAKMDKI